MKIAIAWYGAEGQANYQYYTAQGHDVTIVTPRVAEQYPIPSGAQAVVGPDAFDKLQGYDLVVRSAAVRPDSLRTDGKIWSATNEFFANCPAPIIGVTGTKGKGTTSSLITSILRAAGRTVHLVGNIGQPALEVLASIKPSDIVVYELSSFQLWDLERSPQVAVMTLIEPDHLDVHSDMTEYITAKSRIFSYQQPGDRAVYNEQDETVWHIVETAVQATKATPVPFLNKKFVHIEQGKFYYDDQLICPIDAVKLPGEHNLRNAAAAIAAVWQLIDGDTAAIAAGLQGFDGLPHRLKLVAEVNKVKFYDDSIATTPGSAIAAVKSFEAPIILILGGHDKGADYSELGRAINKVNVKMIYVIGANRDKIADQIRAVSAVQIEKLATTSMPEIISAVYQSTAPGDIVILSPAAASFDMFTSYQDRGDQFVAAVNGLC